jgi:hypothetical protein
VLWSLVCRIDSSVLRPLVALSPKIEFILRFVLTYLLIKFISHTGCGGDLYAEQAQYHAVNGVDTRRHSGQQTTVQTATLSFPQRCLSDRPPYIIVGIGRNGVDSEPSSGGGLSAHVTRQYPKGQSVNAHARSVCPCRLLKARQTIPPTLLTPAGDPVAKTTPGCRRWSMIGVPAAWHRQQSTSPILWDYLRPKGLVVR